MSDKINIVILAAGKGTRLKTEVPKPLCKALNKSLVDYVLREVETFYHSEVFKKNNLISNLSLIVGYKKDLVIKHVEKNHVGQNPNFIWQKEQLGTGHAVKTFFDESPEAFNNKYTLILCADTPLVDSKIFEDLLETLVEGKYDGVCASFTEANPFGYGRIERGEKGFTIVEEKEASEDQKKIQEVNSGIYIFNTSYIEEHISNLENNNKSGEFYLTDLMQKDLNVVAALMNDEDRFLGVNDFRQLARAEQVLMQNKLNQLQASGVKVMLPHTIYIEETVEVEPGAILHSGVNLIGATKIAAGTVIEAGCVIKNSQIEKNSLIKAYSYMEGATVGQDCQVGPMARLREGSIIGTNCKIGNFVETKKAQLEQGAKVSHLSYVGDAHIGENTNIGCGFITCNYDGAQKHKTIIGKGSFIGSDVQTIAPVNIGDNAYIGSGSTINKDVPDKAFAIARQRQTTKPDMAKKFLKKK